MNFSRWCQRWRRRSGSPSGAAAQETAITIEPIGDNLSLLRGAGGNIAVLLFGDGLLLVGSGLPQIAEAVESRTRTDGPGPIALLINTHYHFDHVGGNERPGRAGARIIAHEKRSKAAQHDVAHRSLQPRRHPGAPRLTTSGTLRRSVTMGIRDDKQKHVAG